MPHASRAGSVNGGEAHVPFLGMQGRSNIVDLLHAVHGLGKHGRIGHVCDDDLFHAGRPQRS